MKEYGKQDSDDSAYRALLASVAGKDVKYIMHYPRVDTVAKACRMPGSLRVQAVLVDETVVTALQLGIGKEVKVTWPTST